MEILQDEVLTDKTFLLDGKNLINCRIINCTVFYEGGDWGWTNTSFENCRFNFAGAAQRTAMLMNFLQSTGSVQGGPIPLKKLDGTLQ